MGVKRLHNINSAAKYLGVSPYAIRTLIDKGLIPIVLLGTRKQLIDVNDLEAFISDNKSPKCGGEYEKD